MKKKRILLLAAALLAASLLAGCGAPACDGTDITRFYGYLSVCPHWVYQIQEGVLFRSHADLTGEKKIADPCDGVMGFTNSTLYYLANDCLYSAGLDGSSPKLLAEWVRGCSVITDRWIYGVAIVNNNPVRIPREGGEMQTLAKDSMVRASFADAVFLYADDTLYLLPDGQDTPLPVLKTPNPGVTVLGQDAYISARKSSVYNPVTNQYTPVDTEGSGLYRYDLQTRTLTKLGEEPAHLLCPTPEGLVYTSIDGALCWLPRDAAQPTVLVEQSVTGLGSMNTRSLNDLEVLDGWVYFRTHDDRCNLCRTHLDTKKTETLSDQSIGSAVIWNNQIYYRKGGISHYQSFQVYRMNPDGSGVQTAADFSKNKPFEIYMYYPYLYTYIYTEDEEESYRLTATKIE